MFDFASAFRAFEDTQRTNGNTDVTIRWYYAQLGVFNDWLDDTGHKWPDWCTVETIEQFLAGQSRRYKPRTVDARRRALSAFLNWCEDRGRLDGLPSPMRRVKPVRIPKTAPRRASLSEYEILIKSISINRWIDARDKAIVVCLFGCGLRISEAAGLHLSDIDSLNRLVLVRSGKRGNDRYVPFADDLAIAIAGYMMSRPAYAGPDLWLADDGTGGVKGPLTSSGIAQRLKRLCKRAGIKHLNPHSFRHAFATEFMNAGADMSAISKMLGHKDIKTTKDIYAEWLTSGISREYQEAWKQIQANKNSRSK